LLQSAVDALLSGREMYPSDGSRAYGSSLVDGRVVDVSSASYGATQVARTKATVVTGG
jgi:hypothetical protein